MNAKLDTSHNALLESALCPAGMPIAQASKPFDPSRDVRDPATFVRYTLLRMGVSALPPRHLASDLARDLLGVVTAGRLPVWQEHSFIPELEQAKTFDEYRAVLLKAANAEPVMDIEAHDRHLATVQAAIARDQKVRDDISRRLRSAEAHAR
jgi:hypothetical protein